MRSEQKIVQIPNALNPPMRPATPPPVPEHDEDFFNSVELIKPKGRRTKKHSWDYQVTWIPWEDFNDTELLSLCLRDVELSDEMDRWTVLHRGLPREKVIGIIRGEVDPRVLTQSPVHKARQGLQMLMYENWRHIWSQIGCNTYCWECTDAKALECTLENYESLPGDVK